MGQVGSHVVDVSPSRHATEGTRGGAWRGSIGLGVAKGIVIRCLEIVRGGGMGEEPIITDNVIKALGIPGMWGCGHNVWQGVKFVICEGT